MRLYRRWGVPGRLLVGTGPSRRRAALFDLRSSFGAAGHMSSEMPDPDDLVVPDLPDAIVAWRQWTVDDDGLLLSPMFSAPWPTDAPMIATCREGMVALANSGEGISAGYLSYAGGRQMASSFGPAMVGDPGRPVAHRPRGIRIHTAPCGPDDVRHTGHGCGIYGVRDPAEVDARFGRNFTWDRFHLVAGSVWLSGTVWEYSEGYRASRATPKSLWWWPNEPVPVPIALAAERYGLPLEEPVPQRPRRAALSFHRAHVAAMPVGVAGGFATPQAVQVTQQQMQQAIIKLTMRLTAQLGPITNAFGQMTSAVTQLQATWISRNRRRRRLDRKRARRRRRRPAHLKPIPAEVERARARLWAGGAAAAAALALAGWRRGDLLWWTAPGLLALATLAALIQTGRRSMQHKPHHTDEIEEEPDAVI